MTRATGARTAAALLLGMIAAACAKDPGPDPYYRPAENVIEVVAVLRRHVTDDTYRFQPARDFTGRNIYRASLIRLENLESAHASDLRAGHMEDVIAFAKGRALERLRGYELAARSYRRAVLTDGPLRADAMQSAAICEALAEAIALAPGFVETAEPDPRPSLAIQEEALAVFEKRRALLETIEADVGGNHYAYVVREELEHTDMEHADYRVQTRHLTPDGDVRALAALQKVILEHRDSKNANRALLALADLYAELAEDYVEAKPPESLDFDPPTFEELANNAARLYEAVANQDGATERIEATRQLEAFLAFTLRVDHDRFSR